MSIYWLFIGYLVSKYRVFNGYNDLMELQPSEPPGNAKRKLRGYVDEIARLRAEGYTIRAVHKALINVGVVVAWATVQREAARLDKQRQTVKSGQKAEPASTIEGAALHQAVGLDIVKKANADEVESYFAKHNANPLFRKKKAKIP